MSAFDSVFESIKSEARSEAVFTESQINQIIKIDLAIQSDILCKLEELKKKILEKSDLDKLICEIESCKSVIAKLIAFEEKEKEIIEELRCQTAKNTKEIRENEMKIKILESRELRDDRVDDIMAKLSNFATQKEIDQLERAIKALASKEYKDNRYDVLIQELKSMKAEIKSLQVVNAEQSRVINSLSTQNAKQNHEIDCLNDLIKRNTVVLSNEIHDVEKHMAVDAKVDMDQNTDIRFLHGEIVNLKEELQRLTNSLLVRQCPK